METEPLILPGRAHTCPIDHFFPKDHQASRPLILTLRTQLLTRVIGLKIVDITKRRRPAARSRDPHCLFNPFAQGYDSDLSIISRLQKGEKVKCPRCRAEFTNIDISNRLTIPLLPNRTV